MKMLFTFVLLFNSIYGISQLYFEHITADDGLSDNSISSLYRDSKDHVWIGTNNNGLNKYDGKKVVIYENIDNQPGSISNNDIRYIYEDSKNNLWIGTVDGLNLYNPDSESFIVFRQNSDDSSNNNTNYVTCILEDKKGNLWVTYNLGAGLTKWDFETKNFIRYRIKNQNDDFCVNSMTSIGEDSKGNLWIASRGPGIYRFEPETGNFVAYNDPTIDFGENLNKKICVDRNDKIWIGSYGSGLYLFEPSTGKYKHFETNIDNGINNNLVSDILQIDDDNILIATDQGGINRYNMVSGKFEYIMQDEKVEIGLNNNGILCLHQDKEGILWVGTSRGGVNYFNPKEHKFRLYNHTNKSNSLSYNIVGCFYEDSEGLIWIGTDGGGVNVFDPKTGNFTFYVHDPFNPNSISGNVIRSISEDKDNDIWIGTWDAGLNRYDKKTKKFYHYFTDKNNPSGISSNSIWQIKIDHKNNIWLSNFSDGVEIFDKKKGVVKRFFPNPEDSRSLSNNNAWLIYEDFQQNIWICTSDGINLYDSITNTFTVYNNFPDNDIMAFCKDKEGKLWAGSKNKGLFLFEQDGTILKIYNKKNGLPDNAIHAIVEDNNGNLWISTNRGIARFNQKKQEFKTYNISDGLQGNVFFEQSFLKTRKGDIYFGGYNGFNSFCPDSLKDNDYIPKVYITDFQLFNKSVPFGIPGSPLQKHISQTKEITLSWRESVFSFEFVAINYTNTEKNKYAYKMEGFEEEWNYTNASRRYVTYTNLEPGEYTFRVKASNNDGIWNEEGVSIKINILPPWWQTWWFRILAICLILFSVIGVFNYRIYQLRMQKILLSKMVRERTLQLEEVNTCLEEKQEEITTQNEELQQQQENLQEANRTLEELAHEIENQNNELHQHRDHLEQLVLERTADLVAAMKKVEESDRLKSTFLSNMSHEIRTPMNAIVGFSALLSEQDISNSDKEEFISYIRKNSEALLVLIDDILEMSKIQANQLVINCQAVNVIEIMNELFASFRLQSQPKGVELIIDTGNFGDSLKCFIDPIRLKQVLSNLIGNALKFTENGFVKFGVTIQNQGFVTFYVKDSGIGIPKDVGNSIFERFLKVEPAKTKFYEGVGLGLSICYSIVKTLGGNIWYESDLGKGTTFYFTIPHNDSEHTALRKVSEIDGYKIPNLEDKKILIVEDDETNYRLLKHYMSKTKARLTWAKNGQEALENVKNNNNFDLILMDLKLPVMDGVEASKLIRQINPNQLIVAQTAFAQKEEKIEFLKCEFNGYLEKPVIIKKLMDTLNEVLKM